MKPLTLIASTAINLFLCLQHNDCAAQEKSKSILEKVNAADFTIQAVSIVDSNTNAIILSDIGTIHFIGNNRNWFSHVFVRKTRIKILNKKAFELATVKIPLYAPAEDPEKLDKVVASSFNLEDGKVIETPLDKNEIFQDREDKKHIEVKFTLPAVKEGSIIEYTYTITSGWNYNLHPWAFQSMEYPCLWSEYEVTIPQTLTYVYVRQGIHKFDIDKGSEGHENYTVTTKQAEGFTMQEPVTQYVSANTLKHRWVMKDIPAFHEENYLSTPSNYIDKIEFQESKYYNGSETVDVTNNWKKANEELLKASDFGLPITENIDWLAEYVNKAAAKSEGALDNAKAIYYYFTSHFTCNNHYNKYIRTTLQEVVKKNSGTVGDLNLLLIALLRLKAITADPVILSTREYGFNLVKYPILERLNYVIARVSIAGKIYYLDAAHPQLGFGQLADNCYNGHARIISDKDSGSVYFEADSLREKKSTMVMIMANDKGELEGSYQSTLGLQESYNTREKVSSIGESQFFKDIQTSYGEDLDISQGTIDSLKIREDPLTVRYEFSLKQGGGSTLIYLNPMFADARRQNPFTAAERKYPVEMYYAMDQLFTFNMQIPEGYVVDEIPKSAKVALNGDQGLFEYLISQGDGLIQMRCHLKLNKAWFPAEDYASLRDFFAYVVKKESEQIVLKKK